MKRLVACALALTLALAGCAREERRARPRPVATPRPLWADNIAPPADEPITLAWSYRPTQYAFAPGLTVLAPTWLYVAADDSGSPKLDDMLSMGYTIDYAAFIADAHADGVEIWVTVVSFNAELSAKIVRDAQTRLETIRAVVDFAREIGADGVNLDFEYMDPKDALLYSAFAEQLNVALGEDLPLSADVTPPLNYPDPGNWWQCFDYPSLGKAADYLAVMTYDQHGSFSDAGPTASYDWVEYSVRLLLNAVPADKVLLGIPYYGKDFRYSYADEEQTPLWPQQDTGVATVLPADLESLTRTGSFTDNFGLEITVDKWIARGIFDPHTGTGFSSFVDTDGVLHKIWLENGESLRLKAGVANRYGLAGVAIWQQRHARDEASYWMGVAEGLGDYKKSWAVQSFCDALRGSVTSAQLLQDGKPARHLKRDEVIRFIEMLRHTVEGPPIGIDYFSAEIGKLALFDASGGRAATIALHTGAVSVGDDLKIAFGGGIKELYLPVDFALDHFLPIGV